MKTLFAGALTAFALLAGGVSAEVLKMAHNAAPGNPKDLASQRFAELVEEKTEGRITVDVGGSAQYGDDVEALTQMRLGTLALAANSQGSTSGVVEEFAVIGLPFLFSDLSQAWEVLDGEVGQKLDEAAQAQGLKVLAFWDNGIRQISNNTRPITTTADLEGLKIRTPPDPMTLEIFETLGANPTPMAFSELYVALQQGVVDGQENPLMNIESSKLYEVQKYISLTGHKYESTPVLVSRMIWDGLEAADQQALLDAAAEAGEYNRELSQKSDAELRPKLEEAGVTFNEVDTAPFIEATAGITAEWREKYPDLVDTLMSATGR
ncbi:TRAP transporter substrate-binding protein [Paracoccus tegillarcae]|uniref:C4-dicarboxylate ABC transporter n=1 Tax=Paracoccus tegillarcae TaxID=1529068 RepID=A0A2K9EZC3_9RHOB|nr:TRAP transporter substrate-binding protein [Paracoccus tegillarcae]AUH32241.1 C4-dicarboxylate ABC transporter [Paracoccus tegillarcae]